MSLTLNALWRNGLSWVSVSQIRYHSSTLMTKKRTNRQYGRHITFELVNMIDTQLTNPNTYALNIDINLINRYISLLRYK